MEWGRADEEGEGWEEEVNVSFISCSSVKCEGESREDAGERHWKGIRGGAGIGERRLGSRSGGWKELVESAEKARGEGERRRSGEEGEEERCCISSSSLPHPKHSSSTRSHLVLILVPASS
eukprot:323716-Hanusia_phi.AAC.1